jgi:hypothetical protein
MGGSDVKTVFNILPFGIDSNPPEGYRAIYADTGINGEKILLGVLNENVQAEVGGLRIFSIDSSGNEATSIYLRANGDIELGGNTNYMTKFTELKSGFDELKGDFNTHVQNYNSHVHPGVTAGSASTAVTVTISEETEASIDLAKIDNIKTS